MHKETTTQSGFTLMELMIATAIVGILMGLAFPSFQSYIKKSHRSDGVSTLIAIQAAEEQYRVGNTSYGDLNAVWGGTTTSPAGYYTLGISNTSATGYTLTATATGSQIGDSEDGSSCNTLSFTINGLTETKTPAACWD